MGGVCTCICVCLCVLGKHAQMCILREAALTSCAFCKCSPHSTVRLRLSLEPRPHWVLLRQLTSRDPISMVQVVRLYTSHCAQAEFRQLLGIWAAVFMCASIHWFIFSSSKHVLTCFILTYLVYVHTHTPMYATVNVWHSNYNLTNPVPSFHHGHVLPPRRTGCQTLKLGGRSLCSPSHLANLQITALSHTCVSPLSFICIRLFLKCFS